MPDPADRDLLAELESLSTPGLTMDPLPASEVRRRGTRMRRRQHVIATVGAAAAVAVIATPIALAVGGSDAGRTPAPAAAPPGGWTTTIPDDFPIRDGFPTPAETRPPAYGAIPNCGGWPSERTRDDLAVRYEGKDTEDSAQRWLAVYPDAATAAAELDALRDATTDCAPAPADGGSELFFGPATTPAGTAAEDVYSYTQQSRAQDGLIADLTLVTVYRTGNALLYEDSYGTAGGDDVVRQELARRTDAARETVAAMCVFSVEGCSPAEPDASEAADPTLSGAIPDDFPLADGLPTAAGPGVGVGLEGPARDLDLAPYNLQNTLQACGVAPSGLPAATDTLYAGYRSASTGILRQLMTFESEDRAQRYAERLLAPFAACPDDTDAQGVSTLNEITPEDAGDHGASMVLRHEVDGEPGPGVQLLQVVRVGSAVLQTLVLDEGVQLDRVTTPETLRAQYLDASRSVLEAMAG